MPAGSNILAVILGASEWPYYETLEPSPAFENSANFFVWYLRNWLEVPDDNILWMFNSDKQPGEIEKDIRSFMKERISKENITDTITYYVGHGAPDRDRKYFVATRCLSKEQKNSTSFRMEYLASTLSDLTFHKRNLIFLDACYSGAALKEFIDQSETGNDPAGEVREAFQEVLPLNGTALFCAAGPTKTARAPVGDEYTMFTGALAQVLQRGDPTKNKLLSLKEVGALVEFEIKKNFRSDAVRPQIHTPVQHSGDIAFVPYFPNAAYQDDVKPELKSSTLKSHFDRIILPIFHKISSSEIVKRLLENIENIRKYILDLYNEYVKTRTFIGIFVLGFLAVFMAYLSIGSFPPEVDVEKSDIPPLPGPEPITLRQLANSGIIPFLFLIPIISLLSFRAKTLKDRLSLNVVDLIISSTSIPVFFLFVEPVINIFSNLLAIPFFTLLSILPVMFFTYIIHQIVKPRSWSLLEIFLFAILLLISIAIAIGVLVG